MPVNKTSYQNGKIYKIWSLETDKIYVGSTCDTLTNRMCKHRLDYKNWKEGKRNLVTSAVLFDLVGLENCKLELIHNFPCESKNELEAEEGRVMRLNKGLLVNMVIAGRSKAEYYQDNKGQINIKNKEYRDSHKEQNKEYMKEYRDLNKEQIKIKQKEYRQQHKQELSIKQSQKMNCECGDIHTLSNKSQHLKSKKHQNFIKPQ